MLQYTHFQGLTYCSMRLLLGPLFHEFNVGLDMCTCKLSAFTSHLWDCNISRDRGCLHSALHVPMCQRRTFSQHFGNLYLYDEPKIKPPNKNIIFQKYISEKTVDNDLNLGSEDDLQKDISSHKTYIHKPLIIKSCQSYSWQQNGIIP